MDYFTFVEKCKEFILWRNIIFMLTINKYDENIWIFFYLIMIKLWK
jgi:hypothetical protein